MSLSAFDAPSSTTNNTTKTADQFHHQVTSLLREPSTTDMGSPRFQLKPVVTNQNTNGMGPSLPLITPKSKFISASLPNSAKSSLRFNTHLVKKHQRNQSAVSHQKANYSPGRHHSPIYSVIRQESCLSRSRSSCGEGRLSAHSDEFDLSLSKLNRLMRSSFDKKPEAEKDGKKVEHSQHSVEEKFKCGKMCSFLAGFSKRIVGRQTRKEEMEVQTIISNRVSLEMFECGSGSSSAIANDNGENDDSVHLYFDLPLELIRATVNDAHSSVTAAFVFDKDRKGILKNGKARAGGAKKSSESGRHVRFSSNPQSFPESPISCITTRLRKESDEFNGFLEA